MGQCEHISRNFCLSFRANYGHLRLAEPVCREDLSQAGRSLPHNVKREWQKFGGEGKDWLVRGNWRAGWQAGVYWETVGVEVGRKGQR